MQDESSLQVLQSTAETSSRRRMEIKIEVDFEPDLKQRVKALAQHGEVKVQYAAPFC